MGAIMAHCTAAALGGHVEACDDCGVRGSPITPVVIAIVQNVRARLGRNGWPPARPNCCRFPTSPSSSPLPAPVGAVAFQNKAAVYAILVCGGGRSDDDALAANPRRLASRSASSQSCTHGPGPDASSTRALRRARRRSVARRNTLDCRAAELLPSRQAARKTLPPSIPRTSAKPTTPAALNFFGDLVAISANPASFGALVADMRGIDWVVYAKKPSVEPPRRSPISVAIHTASPLPTAAWPPSKTITSLSPGRIIARTACKIMKLVPDEFIRRFLLHILPDGFRRIRHFGFMANGCSRRNSPCVGPLFSNGSSAPRPRLTRLRRLKQTSTLPRAPNAAA